MIKKFFQRSHIAFKTCLLLILFFLHSCSTYVDPSSYYKSVPYGKIITDGVEISSLDDVYTNPFLLRSGEIWTPPFQNMTPGFGMNTPNADMVNFYKTAVLRMGAKMVMVKVPYQSEPLYGILLLAKIYPQGNSAVTRSYQISIPKSYVDAAQNGRVSVLYEYYDTGDYDSDGRPIVPKTWVLWLSDIPFSL